MTLPEVVICMVLVTVLATVAGPSVSGFRGGHALRGARGEVVATIEAARAAAIQRGQAAWVVRRGNTLVAATLDGNLQTRVVLASADLHRLYGATLVTNGTGGDSMTFDSRGLTKPRLAGTVRYVLSAQGTTQRDSVCVMRLGLLLPSGCAP